MSSTMDNTKATKNSSDTMSPPIPSDLDIEAMIWRLEVYRKTWTHPSDRLAALLGDAAAMLTDLRSNADRWRTVEQALYLAATRAQPAEPKETV